MLLSIPDCQLLTIKNNASKPGSLPGFFPDLSTAVSDPFRVENALSFQAIINALFYIGYNKYLPKVLSGKTHIRNEKQESSKSQ